MAPPQPTLKERIARLKLQDGQEAPPPSQGPSAQSSRSDVRHASQTAKVSDKISRFAANAEAKPLLPELGSFSGAAPRKSAGGSRERGEDKPRVASLGGGRATVPLNVVKPRSASASGSPTTSSPANSSAGSRAGNRQGFIADEGERVATPVGEPTPIPSPTASTSSIIEKPGPDDAFLSLPAGARTPGAVSVSSMRVETGSLTSDGAAHNPADLDVSAANLADELHSPLSSPVLAGVAAPGSTSSAASVASSDGISPANGSAKGPLTSLRLPSRAESVASLSSMLVEAPPEDVADLADMSGAPETPLAEPSGLVGLAVETPSSTNGGGLSEEQRAELVGEELAKYEKDEQDPAARVPGSEMSNGGAADEGEAKEPPSMEEAEADAGAGLPKVKCNDCGDEVDLMLLADHSCASSGQPPALSSPPMSPEATRSATLSPSPSMRSIPESAPPAADKPASPASPRPTSPTSPRNLASSIRSSLSRSASQQSNRSQASSRSKPPPADVPQDVPEDVLDPYGVEDIASPRRSVPKPAEQDLPEDVEGEHTAVSPTSPVRPLPDLHSASPLASLSTSMARSASTPSQHPTVASHLRAQKAATGPRSQSVYGGPMPGKYYSSDDEDGYEGGSATIVRSTPPQGQ
ncbi:hypothetical protein JCM10207_002843 [Rhodosporidiobolus poonsookiae]